MESQQLSFEGTRECVPSHNWRARVGSKLTVSGTWSVCVKNGQFWKHRNLRSEPCSRPVAFIWGASSTFNFLESKFKLFVIGFFCFFTFFLVCQKPKYINWSLTSDSVHFGLLWDISCCLLYALLTHNTVENQLCWQGTGQRGAEFQLVRPCWGLRGVIACHAGTHRDQW